MSTMRRSLLIATLTLIAVGGWLTFRLLTTEQSMHERDFPAARAADLAESRQTSTRSAARSESRSIAPTRFRETAEERAKAAATQPAGPKRTLSVVLGPDGRPAAGAIVEFRGFDSEEGFPGSEAELDKVPPIELVANAGGIVALPEFKLIATVKGRSGHFSGRAQLFAAIRQEPILRLRAPVPVLVVDGSGRPVANVPVAMLDRTWRAGRFDLVRELPVDRGTTGIDGLVLLDSPPQPDETYPRNKSNDPRTRSVALALPLTDPVDKSFELDQPPSEPIRLVLPPTGRLVVKLVGPGGAPFDGDARVEIHPIATDQPVFVGRLPSDALSASAVSGTATFPFVGPVGKLRVLVVPANPAFRTVESDLDGPRRTDQDTIVTIACGDLATNVAGRLVTADGLPATKVTVDGRLRPVSAAADRRNHEVMFRRPGADGRFSLHFDVDPSTATEIDLGIADQIPLDGTGGYQHRTRFSVVKLPESIRTGFADVGDVVVNEVAVLAAGIVVSTDGARVPRARVQVMRRVNLWWESGDYELRAAADPDGRFELRGSTKARRLGLVARADGWICVEPTPFDPGARDVKVVMTRAGGLAGSLANVGRGWRSFYSDAPLEVRVAGAKIGPTVRNAGDGNADRLVLPVSNDGVFQTHELPPGTYTVRIAPPGPGEPLLTVKDIVVNAGETNRDPRLQGIDLTKLTTSRTVTVVDEHEKPMPFATVGVIRTQDGSRTVTKFEADAEGQAIVMTPEPSIEIVVAMKGYRAVTRSNVTGDVTVALTKADPIPVNIRLADSVELPAAPFIISAGVRWLSALDEPRPRESARGDPRSEDGMSGRFQEDRVVSLTVQNPGIYEVQLWLLEESTNGVRTGGLAQMGGTKAILAVPEEGPASVTVNVDRETLKKAIADRKMRSR